MGPVRITRYTHSSQYIHCVPVLNNKGGANLPPFFFDNGKKLRRTRDGRRNVLNSPSLYSSEFSRPLVSSRVGFGEITSPIRRLLRKKIMRIRLPIVAFLYGKAGTIVELRRNRPDMPDRNSRRQRVLDFKDTG